MMNQLNGKRCAIIWFLGNIPLYLLSIEHTDLSSVYWVVLIGTIIYFFIGASKMTEVLNSVCEGVGKRSIVGFAVVLINFLTIGIYGFFWLRNQLGRMDSVRKNYEGKPIDKMSKKWYTGWFICRILLFIVPYAIQLVYILILYDQLEDTLSYNTGSFDVFEYMIGAQEAISTSVVWMCILKTGTAVLHSIFIYSFVEELNRLVCLHSEMPYGANIENDQKSVVPDSNLMQQRNKRSFVEPVTVKDSSVERYVLQCESGIYAGVMFPLDGDDFLMLGRDSKTANIVISDERVSRQHCQIRYNSVLNMFEVVDHSSVGTYMNEKKLDKGVLTSCPVNTYIRLGNSDNVFLLKKERSV